MNNDDTLIEKEDEVIDISDGLGIPNTSLYKQINIADLDDDDQAPENILYDEDN